MPTKKPVPLPESLRYLQAFANKLARLPPEKLNEDVDSSPLDSALRKRVRDMDEVAADAQLAEDRELLAIWLEDKPDHPAHWIHGFLLDPDLATYLTQPPEPPERGPTIGFVAPGGWKVKVVPFGLNLKKEKLIGTITVIEELSFDIMQEQQKLWTTSPDMELTRTILPIQCGLVSGTKCVFRQTKPFPWNTVNYLLSVPGGFVSATLCAGGASLDEGPFDDQLHTLQLTAST